MNNLNMFSPMIEGFGTSLVSKEFTNFSGDKVPMNKQAEQLPLFNMRVTEKSTQSETGAAHS